MRTHGARRRIALTGLLACTLLLATSACSEESRFAVGDCVKVEDGVLDSDMKEADCADAQGTFDASQRTYRVDSIIDDTSGGCPQLAGFFPVELVHEPHGVTYCLVQQD